MRTIVMLVLVLAIVFSLNAQTSSVKLLDLSLISIVENNAPDINPTKYRVSFKISDISQAQTVHFMLGTSQNQGDVLNVEPTVINQTGVYYLRYEGNDFPMIGKEARFELTITQSQYDAFNVASLYISDINGLNTTPIFFNK